MTRTADNASLARTMIAPLALAQFIASYAATQHERGHQHDRRRPRHHASAACRPPSPLFTLTMASLMIPGSKLTDIWGRKFCFIAGPARLRRGCAAGGVRPGLWA